MTQRSGLASIFEGIGAWAGLLLDYDNDGDLDIFSANGVAEALRLQLPLLLENDGNGHFTDTGHKGGQYFSTRRSGRGAAAWDYDNDGDMDIVVSHVDLEATAALLRNDSPGDHHWLGITLLQANGTPALPGSRIVIQMGDRTLVRCHQPGNAYLSFSDPRVHVGLGTATGVDLLEVHWPDGVTDRFEHLAVDRYMEIRQGDGAD
jgi:hypothetical protein